jgi:hypothetical protein
MGTTCVNARCVARAGATSSSRVAETLATVWPPTRASATMLASLHLHLEHEVDLDRVVEIRRSSRCGDVARGCDRAGVAGAGALGRSKRSYLPPNCLAAPSWPIAHPAQGLIDAVAEEPEVRPEWNLDFASALTRLRPLAPSVSFRP